MATKSKNGSTSFASMDATRDKTSMVSLKTKKKKKTSRGK